MCPPITFAITCLQQVAVLDGLAGPVRRMAVPYCRLGYLAPWASFDPVFGTQKQLGDG